MSRSWTDNIPNTALEAYRHGDKAKFDKYMKVGFTMPGGKSARQTWAFRARPYGGDAHADYAATLDEVVKYDRTGVAEQITTPLYITDSADEQFFPGQSQELARLAPDSILVPFTADEGARFHCQPTARELTEQRMFDWLDDRLA